MPMKTEVRSLRRKLLLWLLLPMLLVWLLSGMGAYYLSSRFANAAFDRILADSARDLALQVTVGNGRAVLDLPSAALAMFLSDEYDRIYYRVTEAGRLVAGDPELPDVAAMPGEPIAVSNGVLGGRPVRIVSRYFELPGTGGKAILVQVAETLNKRRILVGHIITAVLALQFLLMAMVALIVWVGTGKGLSPLKALSGQIESRSYRELSPFEESGAPLEVRSIIRAINGLMRRLGEAIEAQQRFVANAAHQLRTPLAGLKTQTDLALRQTGDEDRARRLRQLGISADRTAHLVNQMLNLAQVEPWAGCAHEMNPLDLKELAREASMEWVPAALQKGIDLGCEGPAAPAVVRADRNRVRMLLDNLIDNAIRYTPAGGAVTVRAELSGGAAVLTVEDSGPGIPEPERESVFQRFYRLPNSSGEGSGLGLSIVREVAAAYGAEVRIEEPAGHRGTSVKVAFPL